MYLKYLLKFNFGQFTLFGHHTIFVFSVFSMMALVFIFESDTLSCSRFNEPKR